MKTYNKSVRRRAEEIAKMTTEGRMDPLWACRQLADLHLELPDVPVATVDVFTAVSSEIDGMPFGRERTLWAPEALMRKDKEMEQYRKSVESVVMKAMRVLLQVLSQN